MSLSERMYKPMACAYRNFSLFFRGMNVYISIFVDG